MKKIKVVLVGIFICGLMLSMAFLPVFKPAENISMDILTEERESVAEEKQLIENHRADGHVQVPSWYNIDAGDRDWWYYSRAWDITLGGMGNVWFHDNCTYELVDHLTVNALSGEHDAYNLSVMSTDVYGNGNLLVEDLQPISFVIKKSGSSVEGYSWYRRSDLSLIRMFVHAHLDLTVTYGSIKYDCWADLDITLEPKDVPEEDFDFPLYTGEKWHLNWTFNVTGSYNVFIGDLQDTLEGVLGEPLDDLLQADIYEDIQMDSDYWCNETRTKNYKGTDYDTYFVDSTGTNQSEAPGGKQKWHYLSEVKWYYDWLITDISLGDMEGEEGKVKSIYAELIDNGRCYNTFYDGYLEDSTTGDLDTFLSGSEVTIRSSESSTASIPELGISVPVDEQDPNTLLYEGAMTLPEVDDTTPCDSDNGSFGIIIEKDGNPSDGNDFVVRSFMLQKTNLELQQVSYPSGLIASNDNITFSIDVLNSGGAYISQDVAITLDMDDSEAKRMTVSPIYGKANPTYELYWDAVGGQHNLTFTLDADNVIDELDEGDNTFSVEVNVDYAPHAEFTTNVTEVYTGESILFNASGSSDDDGSIVGYSWDFNGDGTTEKDGMEVEHQFADGGPYSEGGKQQNVTLYVEDDMGAVSTFAGTVTVYNRAPKISLEVGFSVGGNQFKYENFDETIIVSPNTEVTFEAKGQDTDGNIMTQGYEWDLGGQNPGTTQSVTYEWYSETDVLDCSVRAKDDDQEYSNQIDFQMQIANMPPDITVDFDNLEVETYEEIELTATCFDPDGSVNQLWWDFDTNNNSDGEGGAGDDYDQIADDPEYDSATVSFSDGTEEGKEYHIKVSARDNKNIVNEKVITVLVYNQAPEAVLPSGMNMVQGKEATFDLDECTDVDGEVADYYLDFGDGNNSGWVSTPKISYTYTAEGTYTVKLNIRDDDGAEANTSKDYTVKFENIKPKITLIDAPDKAVVDEEVSLKIEANDPDGNIVQYQVDFGDGTLETNDTFAFAHVYTEAGEYTIKVTVKDDIGDITVKEKKITVEKKGGGGGGKEAESDISGIIFAIIIVIVIVVLVAVSVLMKKKGPKTPPSAGKGNQVQGPPGPGQSPRGQQGRTMEPDVMEEQRPPYGGVRGMS